MIKREAQFQTKFNRYITNRWTRGNAVFELKCARTDSLQFAEVKEHQINALKVAKHHTLPYKIPDDSLGTKPFDCVVVSGVPAYVAIQYYKPGVKHFYLIDVDIFEKESKTSERRSLTETRAGEIGEKLVFN